MNQQTITFLTESNLIEGVGEEGLPDSIKAFTYLMQVRAPLTEKHILKTHRLLMKNLDPEIAGNIRDGGVQVALRICPPYDKVKVLLPNFLTDINKDIKSKDNQANSEKICKKLHRVFELIHPFWDGNGRVGRMIWNWHRKQKSLPLLIIKDAEKYDYYKLFK